MNNGIESTRSLNHPEDLEAKDLAEEHQTELLRDEEKDLVEWFADDALPEQSLTRILNRFIDDDSGYLQQLVSDYMSGDSIELAETARDLAQALIRHIKSAAGE